jgi:WD40 repeat protein
MSAPHIYLSALPFTSRKSRVHQHFRPQFPKSLSLSERGYSWSSLTNMVVGQSYYVWSDSVPLDGGHSASQTGEGTICTWDAETGKNLCGPLKEQTQRIWSVAFSPDGRCIIGLLGHLKTSQIVSRNDIAPAGTITSVAFSPGRKRIVSCSADRKILIWDAETRKLVSSAKKLHKNYITSLAFSPDAKCVVSGSWDMTICIWDADTGQILSGPLRGHVGGVNSVAFGPDGRRVVSGSDDRTVRIWGLATESISGPLEGHTDQVTCVSFSPDGRHVASGSDDRMICIWDTMNGKMLFSPLKGHSGATTCTAFSPSGKRVISGCVDGTICVWDAETGQLVSGPLQGHNNVVSSLAFSPDGKRFVSGGVDQIVRVWNADPMDNVNLHLLDDWMVHDPVTSDDQNSKKTRGDFRNLLFWVPPDCRKSICGRETVSVIGTRLTRVDLSKFVHGKSWAQCHSDVAHRSAGRWTVQLIYFQSWYISIVSFLTVVVKYFSPSN